MTNISNIVNEAMRTNGLGQYTQQAAPVVKAVEEAQYRVFEGLVQAGRRLGASERQVKDALRQAGLEERPAAPAPAAAQAAAPAAEGGGTKNERIAALEAFARRHGFRG